MHWPYKQHKTSRNQKLLPYHEDLKKVLEHVLVNQVDMKDLCGMHYGDKSQNMNIVLIIKIGIHQ